MAKITLAGKEVDFCLNNYTMCLFGRSIGANKPMEAISELAKLQKDGESFEAQEMVAKLIHHCTKGAISIEEAFGELSNRELMEDVLQKEIKAYIQPMLDVAEEIQKKKKVKEAV